MISSIDFSAPCGFLLICSAYYAADFGQEFEKGVYRAGTNVARCTFVIGTIDRRYRETTVVGAGIAGMLAAYVHHPRAHPVWQLHWSD
jgi:hypothetical protein